MSASAMNITSVKDQVDPYADETLVITNTVLASIICLITIIGVLGNSFVILLVSLSRQLQTVTNIFVVSLTTSDLIGCGMQSLQAVALLHLKGWPLPEWACQMTGGICIIAFVASILHLALISIDRFVLITYPKIKYMQIYTHRNIAIMITLAWLAPMLMIVLPPTLGFGRLGYNADNFFCIFDGTELQLKIVHIFEEILFGITFTIIISCYLKIFFFVRKHHHNLLQFYKVDSGNLKATHENEIAMQKAIDKREIDITKNLFIVVCGFFTCILPNTLCVMTEKCYVKYFKFTAVVFSMNSCINPFIYCFKQPLFRKISLCVLTRRWADIPKPAPWMQHFLNKTSERGPDPCNTVSGTIAHTPSVQTL
ncbi:melatonin receptor type 1B-B-like [Diadema setosum]|uniref:melatonin receptor type 1B-B-like n=1 Tax=Diadema setosum TaxID=31175 RepID=UPI003B3A479F